jgi:hypothetical protein
MRKRIRKCSSCSGGALVANKLPRNLKRKIAELEMQQEQ